MIAEIYELVGETIAEVKVSYDNREMVFLTEGGDAYRFYHLQECCEEVQIGDIWGDLEDLVGSPVLLAEEKVINAGYSGSDNHGDFQHHTWTFYEFATQKGYVTVRWCGSSNCYYGEKVNIEFICGVCER